jgi:hypothetical protein
VEGGGARKTCGECGGEYVSKLFFLFWGLKKRVAWDNLLGHASFPEVATYVITVEKWKWYSLFRYLACGSPEMGGNWYCRVG